MSLISATLGKFLPRYRQLSEWAEIYAQIVASKQISAKTKANRSNYIKRIVAGLGNKHVGAIRPHEIARFIAEVGAKHPHLARRMLIETKEMFREAVNYAWIDRDPSSGIKAAKVKVVRMRLTFPQWAEIYDYAKFHSPPWVSNMLVLALVTGQRRSDLQKMKFSDVWTEVIGGKAIECLHIAQQKTGALIAIPTALRLDALDLSVKEAIDGCRRYNPEPSNDDALLIRKSTGQGLALASMSWRFEQAREMALMKHKDEETDPPSLHECRSLSARLYAGQGIQDVQTLLGHTDQAMTDVYMDDRGLDRRSGRWRTVEI